MTKLTDAELADLVATKVMGWEWVQAKLLGYWGVLKPDNAWVERFDPCNDWNDAFVALNALNDREMDEFEEIITKPLNRYNLHELRENLNPRKLTESILKAAGVDVE